MGSLELGFINKIGSLENAFLKRFDIPCGETVYIRFDLKMLLDKQKEKVLQLHYTSIESFEMARDRNNFSNTYYWTIGQLELMKEVHIDEICELSKTLSSITFNKTTRLDDLSDINVVSLLKWYEKYLYDFDFLKDRDILYNLLYTVEKSILDNYRLSDVIIKRKYFRRIYTFPGCWNWNWPNVSHNKYLDEIVSQYGLDIDIDQVLFETNRIHLRQVIIEVENVVICVRKLGKGQSYKHLKDNCVIEQLCRAQFKDLLNVYTKFFKIYTLNRLDSLYSRRLLSLVNDYIGVDSMATRVDLINILLNFIEIIEKEFKELNIY